MVTKGEIGRREKLGGWGQYLHPTIYKTDN